MHKLQQNSNVVKLQHQFVALWPRDDSVLLFDHFGISDGCGEMEINRRYGKLD